MASPLRRRLPDRLSMFVLTGAYAEKPRGRLAHGFRKNNLGLNWNFSGFIRLGSSKRASNSLRLGLNGVDCVVAVFLAAIFPLFPFSLAKWGTGVGAQPDASIPPGIEAIKHADMRIAPIRASSPLLPTQRQTRLCLGVGFQRFAAADVACACFWIALRSNPLSSKLLSASIKKRRGKPNFNAVVIWRK